MLLVKASRALILGLVYKLKGKIACLAPTGRTARWVVAGRIATWWSCGTVCVAVKQANMSGCEVVVG